MSDYTKSQLNSNIGDRYTFHQKMKEKFQDNYYREKAAVIIFVVFILIAFLIYYLCNHFDYKTHQVATVNAVCVILGCIGVYSIMVYSLKTSKNINTK